VFTQMGAGRGNVVIGVARVWRVRVVINWKSRSPQARTCELQTCPLDQGAASFAEDTVAPVVIRVYRPNG
jgi:hypothetical protein